MNQFNCKRKGIQMGYTVKDLLKSNKFPEMQLIKMMIPELIVKLKESESLKWQIWKNFWGG